ncbi:MAG: 2-succinyl-5-enolpyruvyl-6-hydroxy-3-cyclohexene-1-carboxylic-acid synthase [Acidimicrobiia bacterium]|nr:2-succinyl-5-enolpyruvyl-6-hydroxy-3-cyclohexene-1-carboxylic-acid synthase [Acidimicrobiia bacterium]
MTAPNPSTALARVVVDELTRHGLSQFVAAPGSRSAAAVIASASHPDTNLRMSLDERSAAFFALGVGRASGIPSAVICTSGSAVANLMPAVVEAAAAGVPLVLLTCDRPPELHNTGANQTMAQTGFFDRQTRFAADLGPGEDRPETVNMWRTTVDQAVSAAMGSPPGPVQINLVFREPTSPVTDDGRATAEPFQSPLGGEGARPSVSLGFVSIVPELPQDLISDVDARRGVVVCGESSPEAARSLGDHLGWPVLIEARAGGRSDDVVTAYQHLGHREDLIPEMVIRLGAAGVSSSMLRLLGMDIPQVMVDPHGRWLDPMRSAAWSIRADAHSFWRVMSDKLPRATDTTWRDTWLGADSEVRKIIDQVVDGYDHLTSARVARDVAAATPRTLVVGSSLPIRDVDAFSWRTPHQVVSNRGLSGIDGFVSTTLGVATTDPMTVGLCGDLTFLHDNNGLLLEQKPSLTLVVVDNRGGRMFEELPHARHAPQFDRLFTTPHGRDLAILADFHDLEYVLAEAPEDLGEITGTDSIRLIHVPIDPVKDREAREQIKQAVSQV